MMDIMDLRVVITLVSFLTFIGIVVWAYSGRQKARFDDAANLPFADDDMQQRTVHSSEHGDALTTLQKPAKSGAEVSRG